MKERKKMCFAVAPKIKLSLQLCTEEDSIQEIFKVGSRSVLDRDGGGIHITQALLHSTGPPFLTFLWKAQSEAPNK